MLHPCHLNVSPVGAGRPVFLPRSRPAEVASWDVWSSSTFRVIASGVMTWEIELLRGPLRRGQRDEENLEIWNLLFSLLNCVAEV